MRLVLPRIVVLAGASALALATLGAPQAAAAKKAPVPTTKKVFTAAIDGYAEYNGQTLCDPVTKPGLARLADLLRQTYGSYSIGVVRDCGIGGVSEHKEGRAMDWMVSKRVPEQKAAAKAFLKWLLAADQFGNPAAMARRLGVMYIGWNNKMWRSYDPNRGKNGWDDLKSCTTNPAMKATGYDTYCHRNHIHLSFSWDGADARTSFWAARPMTTPACERRTAPYRVASLGSAADPQVLVDTATGTGTVAGIPCRLGADRWTGDDRALELQVPVPKATTVRLRIERYSSNAPSTLQIESKKGKASVRAGASLPRTLDLPVAKNGRVTLTTNAGEASVRVVGLGAAAGATPAPPPTDPPVGGAKADVSLRAPVTVESGATLTLSGTVSGVPGGALVQRYLKVGKGQWAPRGDAVSPVSGSWTMSTAAPSPQKLRYRVGVLVDGAQVARSAKQVVLVTQAGRPPRTSFGAPAAVTRSAPFILKGKVKDSPARVTVVRYLKVGDRYEVRGSAVVPTGTMHRWRMQVDAPSSAGPLTYRIGVLFRGQAIGWSKVKTVSVG